MPDETNAQKINVLNGGPYRVEGGVPILDHEGTAIEAPAAYSLCPCGGSENKPFCDGIHSARRSVAAVAPVSSRSATGRTGTWGSNTKWRIDGFPPASPEGPKT